MRGVRFLPSSYFGIFQVLFLQSYHQSFRRLPTTRHDFWAMLQGENRDIKVEAKNTYINAEMEIKLCRNFNVTYLQQHRKSVLRLSLH